MTENRFVCPVPFWMRGKLLDFNRLYAYPNEPEAVAGADYLILDSGAYALSKAKKPMTLSYIDKLGAHYKRFKTEDNIYCAAPDASKNPYATVKNLAYYLSKFENNVCPVFQFTSHKFDLSEIKYQIAAYREMVGSSSFVFFSKRGAHAHDFLDRSFKYKIDLIKAEMGASWIHFFAGGWGLKECRLYGAFDPQISIDTINYYESSKEMQWNINNWGHWNDDRAACTLENATRANREMKHPRW